MRKKICQKCKSSNVREFDYLGTKCIICKACGYDESKQFEVYPEAKRSQKAKSSYSVYKTGGHGRTGK